MNCYVHRDRPAVGLCKACGKGLCPECLVEIADGLACRGRCEERARRINAMVDANDRILASANRQARASGWFIALLGALFLGFGLLPWLVNGSTSTLFMAALGAVFAAYGLTRALRKPPYPIAGAVSAREGRARAQP